MGARETCCLATTSPLFSGCEGDVLHITCLCGECVCAFVCARTNFLIHVSHALKVCVCVGTVCVLLYAPVCLCMFVFEIVRETGGRRGRKALHHPLRRPSAPMADSPRLR